MSAIAFPAAGGPDEPVDRRVGGTQPEITWGEIAQRAPLMACTMADYLDQLSVSARPGTVAAFDIALRFFAGRVTEADRWCVCVADIERRHIEDFKLWQAKRPGKTGKRLSTTTIRHRLGLLRTFFERIIEWGYDDASARVPIFPGDFPKADEPLPKFLDDRTMAKFMAAVAKDTNPRRRLMMELLARTGMRVGELASVEKDAMVQISETFRLRIPVGKLHNDRYVPLHPILVDLITDYRKSHGPNRSGRLVVRNDGQPFDRRTVYRYVESTAKRAGIGHTHPHQLRHTLATQAINRGMRLETIAEMLGHRSMDMTLVYARIANRVVADEYAAVMEQIDALYKTAGPSAALPAEIETAAMTRLRKETQGRMLGNGMCTRPAELDCRIESACESCAYFRTGPEFVPVLLRQRDHAKAHGQSGRAALFEGLVTRATEESA